MNNGVFILAINCGSTSTKIAVYNGKNQLLKESIQHDNEQIRRLGDIWNQYDLRRKTIIQLLENKNYDISKFDIIVARGGTAKPIPGGIYRINKKMLEDMKSGNYGNHATNVGCQIVYDLGQELNIPVITVDPPVTDEMCNWARYSGIPQIQRQSSFHALNQKATGRKLAKEIYKKYEDINCIIAHLGGGISVGAHFQGKVIDVNNALNGDGPFAPERAGGLPVESLINLCFSGEYNKKELLTLISGKGGLYAYLGTTDALKIEEKINLGDEKAKEVFEAMAYQVCKEIGACATVLDGNVDAIGFTGSLTKSERLVKFIKSKVAFIAPIYLYPGENEMESLVEGALRFINAEEQILEY